MWSVERQELMSADVKSQLDKSQSGGKGRGNNKTRQQPLQVVLGIKIPALSGVSRAYL